MSSLIFPKGERTLKDLAINLSFAAVHAWHLSISINSHTRSQTTKRGLEVIKLFSCSTQLSTKFILLVNVKMPTIVGILTFISMINTIYERFKAKNFFICWYFNFFEQLKFLAQLS